MMKQPSRVETNRRIESLRHVHMRCTGDYGLVGTGKDREVICDKCNIRYPATPENRLAAIDHNYAGIYLKRLCNEGARKLEG